MKGDQVFFFATLEDIESIFKEVENKITVKYFSAGLFDKEDVSSVSSILLTPDIGHSSAGDWNSHRRFLILPNHLTLNIRKVPQQKGGIKYAVDPTINNESLILHCGGTYVDGVMVAWKIGTAFESSFASEFIKLFTKNLKKSFVKIGAFYVGPIALTKLRSGWRLVTDVKMAKEYDLTEN